MTRPRIGFIGLGIMGAPMARRLIAQGWAVTGWNREDDRYAEVPGLTVAATPAAVRAASDIVILCVLDANAVSDVCFGPNGLTASTGASLVIDTSTINPDKTRDIAAKSGLRWIDAPMSGGPALAEAGKLTLLVGGGPEDVAEARPLLNDLGGNVTHLGPLGSGQTAKIINQAIVGVSYVLMAEVLALTKAAGIDAALLPAALAGGLADSQTLQRIFPQQAARDYDPPRGYARQLDKDLINVAGFAEAAGADLPLVARAIDLYHDWAAANPMHDGAGIALRYDKD